MALLQKEKLNSPHSIPHLINLYAIDGMLFSFTIFLIMTRNSTLKQLSIACVAPMRCADCISFVPHNHVEMSRLYHLIRAILGLLKSCWCVEGRDAG